MPNIPSFSEDMLPRHFPKTRQLEQNSTSVPVPTLPGVSLLLDEENKVPRIEPKKSFQKWKQQHEAIFGNNSTEYESKSEKKQVRFQTNHHADGYFNKRRSLPTQNKPPAGSPKLELSFYEPPALQAEHAYSQKQYQQQQRQQQYPSAVQDSIKLNSGVNSKMKHGSPFVNPPNGLQNMIHFSQFNRAVRSEVIKENCFPNVVPPLCDNRPQIQIEKRNSTTFNGYCCQMNQQGCKGINRTPVTNHCHPCTRELQNNNCVHEEVPLPVAEQVLNIPAQQCRTYEQKPPLEQQLMNPSYLGNEGKPTTPLDDDTLFSIMEEQQQHILMQQNQILMQQKQILIQQNQIFILQHQIEKLLLRNGTVENQSPNREHLSSPICENKNTSPGVMSNALKMRNDLPIPSNGTKNCTSIGVMTSFLDNLNDALPNEIRQFTSETKFTSERGGIASGEQSYRDSMLDRINEVIRNSPAVIDYRTTNRTNRRVSPNKQTDINIAAQTLFYETSSTNNGYINEQKTTDRSFALYMLGMKYCPQDDAQSADKRGNNLSNQLDDNTRNTKRMSSNSAGKDQISVNIPPDAYDYLIRHGLLKK